MSLSLYNATIPNFIQALNAVSRVLDKGAEFAEAKGIDQDSLLELSLADDMWPMRMQLVSVLHHSQGAIQGVRKGEFSPPTDMPEKSYSDFQQMIAEAAEQMSSLTEEEINGLEGKDMKFKSQRFELPFVAENFLLSFSYPNFYFHVTTAYDLLRKEGVELSKLDYLGRMRKES